MLLTPAELVALTGYQQPARQARALTAQGVPFVRRADGRLSVTWEMVHRAKAPLPKTTEPDYSAARG